MFARSHSHIDFSRANKKTKNAIASTQRICIQLLISLVICRRQDVNTVLMLAVFTRITSNLGEKKEREINEKCTRAEKKNDSAKKTNLKNTSVCERRTQDKLSSQFQLQIVMTRIISGSGASSIDSRRCDSRESCCRISKRSSSSSREREERHYIRLSHLLIYLVTRERSYYPYYM